MPAGRQRAPGRPRGAGSTAHTVVPEASARTPQLEHRCSTMDSPRPPTADRDGRDACGRVALPPSLTSTSSDAGLSTQAARIRASGSGRACRIALLSSSLSTSAASATHPANRPAPRNSVLIRPRATATLDGTHGRSTTLAALTSSRRPPRGRVLASTCERDARPGPAGNRPGPPGTQRSNMITHRAVPGSESAPGRLDSRLA